MAALDSMTGAAADDVAHRFLGLWRMVLERSLSKAGCALLAVTVATDSPDLLELTGTYFRGWRSRLAELLEAGGLSSSEATGFAVLMVAASEGAVVMSRAEQSMEPFDLVAARILVEISGKLTGRHPVAAPDVPRPQ
jgi:TetR/AcrR family transcriptional repressor of lmrAB and yxaGH operons